MQIDRMRSASRIRWQSDVSGVGGRLIVDRLRMPHESSSGTYKFYV